MVCARLSLVFSGLVLLAYARAQTTVGLKCRAINEWAGQSDMDTWCTDQCAIDHCPEYACNCDPPTTTSTPTVTTPTQPKTTPTQPPTVPSTGTNCKAINLWTGYEILDRWCAENCPKGHCPETSCKCTNQSATNQQPVTSSPTTSPLAKTSSVATPTTASTNRPCKAISIWKDISVFDQWCTENCAKGKNYCPSSTCVCSGPLVAPMNNQPTPQRIKTTTPTKRTTTTKPTPTKATYTTREPTTTSTLTTTMRTFSTPTQAPVVLVSSASYKRCSSNGVLAGDYWNGWCQKQCDKNDCQSEYCNCY